jgi:hypothetical protein
MAAAAGDRLIAVLDTVSVAETGALLPPGPAQVSEYVVVALTAPVAWVPLTPIGVLQPPDAVQELAFIELQVNVEDAPGAITEGYTDSVAEVTFTVAVAGALMPPAPEQTSVYVVGAATGSVVWVPLVARVPVQPPVAVQEVALVELHVSVAVLPAGTALGVALNAAVGRGLTTMVTLAGWLVPPAPAHDRVKVAVLLSAPVLWLPLVAKLPVQPPEAEQDVALVEDHVNVAEPPAPIVAVDAWRDAVGRAGAGDEPPPPPPQADSAKAAANTRIESMMRMRLRGDLVAFDHMSPTASLLEKNRRKTRTCNPLRNGHSIMLNGRSSCSAALYLRSRDDVHVLHNVH